MTDPITAHPNLPPKEAGVRCPAPPRACSLAVWLAPLALYLVLLGPALAAQYERMNGDGICYLRHALYLAQGRWLDSVSGYWSPLLSWSLAPFLAAGLDGIHAAHGVMALWGIGFIAAGRFFLRKFTTLAWGWELALLCLLAIQTVNWVAELVTPDVPLALCLLLYSGCSLDPDLLRRPRWPWLAGLLGGVSYLAKSYGLPFFCAHFTLMVACRYWVQRPSVAPRQALRAWGIGLLAFLLVAGPWIGLLSAKHGRLTFSTVAKIAHTVTGPPDLPRAHPTDQLWDTPPGRITVWEIPHTLPYNHWSPLQSGAYFKHQLKMISHNLGQISATLNSFDALRFFPAALILFPFLLLIAHPKTQLFPVFWLWTSAGLYAGGFLPLFFEARYATSYLWPLCVFFFFNALLGRPECLLPPPHSRPASARFWTGLLPVVCLCSFLHTALLDYQSIVRNPATRLWRQLAGRLTELHCSGPLAVSPGSKTEGMLTAYLWDKPFPGVANGNTTAEIEADLEKHHINTFLVRETKWPLARQFMKETRWTLKDTFKHPDATLLVFVPNR